jgi:hypothetical protein
MPAVPAVLSGGRRSGYLALAATALAALLIGASLFATSRDRGLTAQSVPTVTASATETVTKPTSEPSNQSTDIRGEEPTIQLEVLADSARPFQPVPIEGIYRGRPETFAGAALGARRVAGLSGAREARPVGPVHRFVEFGAAGSLPASPAGPPWRNVQDLCASEGLTAPSIVHTLTHPRDSGTAGGVCCPSVDRTRSRFGNITGS